MVSSGHENNLPGLAETDSGDVRHGQGNAGLRGQAVLRVAGHGQEVDPAAAPSGRHRPPALARRSQTPVHGGAQGSNAGGHSSAAGHDLGGVPGVARARLLAGRHPPGAGADGHDT